MLTFVLCQFPVSSEAGLLTWLFGPSAQERYQQDSGSNIATHASSAIAKLRQKAGTEQISAIQVGEIHGSITNDTSDKYWNGAMMVSVQADYSATFGIPYDLIEKGIDIEKDSSTPNIIVIVSAPVPLLVSVDTSSVNLARREKNGLRTWRKAPVLQLTAQKDLSDCATIDAQKRCRQDSEVLEMTRNVVKNFVLDMIGDLYSKGTKRMVAPHIKVVFQEELKPSPPTPIEIDLGKSKSLKTQDVHLE